MMLIIFFYRAPMPRMYPVLFCWGHSTVMCPVCPVTRLEFRLQFFRENKIILLQGTWGTNALYSLFSMSTNPQHRLGQAGLPVDNFSLAPKFWQGCCPWKDVF